MADAVNQLVERLKDAGERLAHPPACVEDLLTLLDDVELLLGKVDQSAPPMVQQALLPAMKAFVADQLFKHSNMDVRITVAACLHEIMRLTAPDAPYNDDRMKEIFELIMASFEKISLMSGRAYTKAISILDSVSKLRSCVMMLDLECDALIVNMFEQFQKNIRSDHSETVLSAMEAIMTLVIDESEDITLELLKVILSFVRKENQNSSPLSWKLGSKVIEDCAEKLKPYLISAINSMEISIDDYSPVVASIIEWSSPASDQNHANDSEEQVVKEIPDCNATSGEAVQFNNDSKHVFIPDSKKYEQVSITKNQHPKIFPNTKHIEKSNSADGRLQKKELGSKKLPDGKPSGNPGKGHGTPSVSKGMEQSIASLQGQHRTTAADSNALGTTLALGGLALEEELVQLQQLSDGTKIQAKSKELSKGSGKKRVISNSKKLSSENSENQEDKSTKKVTRRKRKLVSDEVFETPHGIKYYKEDLIGCKVKVWWPKDKTYYEGVVSEFDPLKMKHKIEYDDGDEEILNLRKEIWELIGDDDEETDDEVAHLLSNLQQPKGSAKAPQRGAKDKERVPDSGIKSKEEREDAGDFRAGATEKSRDIVKRRRSINAEKA